METNSPEEPDTKQRRTSSEGKTPEERKISDGGIIIIIGMIVIPHINLRIYLRIYFHM